jgi:hypothetical protein
MWKKRVYNIIVRYGGVVNTPEGAHGGLTQVSPRSHPGLTQHSPGAHWGLAGLSLGSEEVRNLKNAIFLEGLL